MNREKILNTFGLALLIICFAIALLRIFNRETEARDTETVVIRFAHWQLEGGLRDAMNELAREYESQNPGVRIEQVAIPERIYPQWVKTQLIGATATDMIQIGKGTDDEVLARFFVPLTEIVEFPNPYNRGTELETTRWRDTFVDGMQSALTYRPNLLEYYGIPASMFTVRMFYNRTLWRQLLGDTPTPSSYEEFIALCQRINEVSAARGREILPIAGSQANGPMLINRIVSSQTQRLAQDLTHSRSLKWLATDIALAYLSGEWSVDHPAYTDALTITREIGLSMQPGYQQLGREDATFYFVQGRALMITTGSWDAPSFRAQAPFEIGVFDIPLPSTDHPRYGRNTLGRASEIEAGTGMSFGITRQSPHFDQAIDFLHYITSKSGNTTFTETSGWLPSVQGVEVPDLVRPFLPYATGYVDGFDFSLANVGAENTRVINNAMNALVRPPGSVEAFQNTVRPQLTRALREDLDRNLRVNLLNITRQDVILSAQLALLPLASPRETPFLHRKVAEINEAQNLQEATRAWITHELARLNN